jgi:hypothetical protein
VIEHVTDAVAASESVTSTVNVNSPSNVGLPDMIPVAGSSVNPGGNPVPSDAELNAAMEDTNPDTASKLKTGAYVPGVGVTSDAIPSELLVAPPENGSFTLRTLLEISSRQDAMNDFCATAIVAAVAAVP